MKTPRHCPRERKIDRTEHPIARASLLALCVTRALPSVPCRPINRWSGQKDYILRWTCHLALWALLREAEMSAARRLARMRRLRCIASQLCLFAREWIYNSSTCFVLSHCTELRCSLMPLALASWPIRRGTMVLISVLNNTLVNITNAERRGKRQVLVRPSSKVVIMFLQVMQKHGTSIARYRSCVVGAFSPHSPQPGQARRARTRHRRAMPLRRVQDEPCAVRLWDDNHAFCHSVPPARVFRLWSRCHPCIRLPLIAHSLSPLLAFLSSTRLDWP